MKKRDAGKKISLIARVKRLLGYRLIDDISVETLLENTLFYYENIIGCMPGNVYWMNADCIAVGCNQNVLDMFRLTTLSDFQGLSFEQMGEIGHWPDSVTQSFKLDTQDVIKTGVPKLNIEEPPIIGRNGTPVYFLTHRVPLLDQHNHVVGVVGISIDITDRKKMEVALHNEKIKAEAANQAKTEFIANMSHDIRTPLTGVIGMSKMLEDSVADLNQKNYAQWLGESGTQLLNMLNGVLDVVQADNVNENDIHEQPFDVRHTLEDLLKLERPSTVVKGIDLITYVDEGVPYCLISDPTKFHRILLNLLGNAIKFTQEGHVKLDVQLIDAHKDRVTLRVEVSDTGIGIPHELQHKVFDRFFRITPSYKGIYTGHGVGLHIAQSYAHLLGGNITMTSKPNVGTTFSFDMSLKIGNSALLPVPAEPRVVKSKSVVQETLATPKNSNELPTSAPHLLLVEDNAIALLMLENFVNQAGCRFTSRTDGETALAVAKEQYFDLIITDLGLPALSGIEFTTQLRAFEAKEHKPSTPIIGLTAHVEEKIKQDCIKAGMNNAFTKPMNVVIFDTIKTKFLTSKFLADTTSTYPHPSSSNPAHTDSLGLDLPNTEAELFLLDGFSLLDSKSAIEGMGGKADLLRSILVSVVNEYMPKDKATLEALHDKEDWDAIEKLAHCLKGGTIYYRTDRFVHACQYLERYRKAKHTSLLESLYQQLIRVMDSTTEAIQVWLTR